MISSHGELSGSLWAFIKTRVRLADPTLVIVPPEPLPEADYYLLASLLQKAIRRGDFQRARRAGHQLYKTAPARLWHRLMVIALEDIGIGDPEVAVQLIALSTRPQWREEFGGDLAVLDRLLAEGCTATKDRSSDHAYALISEGHPEPFPKVPGSAPRAELLTAVASTSLPPLMRMDAAVRAACVGHSPKRPPTAQLAGLEALFGLYRELGCPALLVDACKAYTQNSTDELPLLIPLVWSFWTESGASSTTQAHSVISDDVGTGVPSYAFDPIHTRPGIKAVRLWLESVPGAQPWKPRELAAALWNFESATCNQVLSWPVGETLRVSAQRAEMLRAGVPPSECEKLSAWVRAHYPSLAQFRRQVWQEISRQPHWTQPEFKIMAPYEKGSNESHDG